MGSLGASQEKEKELAVLVTGFGPFKEAYPVNPSWEIAALLPDYLPADRVKDAAALHNRQTAGRDSIPPVRILKLPGAVRTSYEYTRDLVPRLWDGEVDGRKVDFAVHIARVLGRETRTSRRICRQGRRWELLGDEKRRVELGENWIWYGVPGELLSDFNVDDVHRRWVQRSPKNLDLRVSEDAGHYLCDFIYFSSLAHLWKQQCARKVVFLHVPLHSDAESLRRGVELVLTLIRSIVESELEKEKEAVSK
ncbi:hypothetical protein RRF57_003936 [Xylaria bambusicola]|uniref:Pyroglutamyl peptidase type I n=1 Tax=Xylaria bambusicola TaxID=326684 RepID=A0AAN7Z811_9PEZI